MKIFLLLIGVVLSSLNALALDQVVLNSGEILQGKVLLDVPNRHVDIQFPNGTMRRIPKKDVAEVERDIPAGNNERAFRGSTSEAFWGVWMGVVLELDDDQKDAFYTASTRIGFNAAQLGNFAKFAPGLRLGYTSGFVELMANLGLRKISNTGVYFTPEFGVGFISGVGSSTQFAGGAVLGYEYFVSDNFSIGPDISYLRIFHPTQGTNSARFTISLTNHF